MNDTELLALLSASWQDGHEFIAEQSDIRTPPTASPHCQLCWVSGSRQRVPSASLPQAFLPKPPLPLSNPAPSERPAGGLSWRPLPGPRRPDLCHLPPQRMARASHGTPNPSGSFEVTSKIQMGTGVAAGQFQPQFVVAVGPERGLLPCGTSRPPTGLSPPIKPSGNATLHPGSAAGRPSLTTLPPGSSPTNPSPFTAAP